MQKYLSIALLTSLFFVLAGCSSYEKQEQKYKFEQMKADKQKQEAEKSFKELERSTKK